MSTTITQDSTWGPQMRDSLLDVPTISIVTPHVLSEVERAVSMEMLFPAGDGGFQISATSAPVDFTTDGNGRPTVAPTQSPVPSFPPAHRTDHGPDRHGVGHQRRLVFGQGKLGHQVEHAELGGVLGRGIVSCTGY